MDASLQNCLEFRNEVKEKKRRKDSSKEGKSVKSRLKYSIHNKAHQEYLGQCITGLAYGSGIVINTAKKR